MNLAHKFAVLTGGLLLSTGGTHAAATRISYMDAFATARGNAFTATADNPSAVFYNGAGLTQLAGSQIHGSIYTMSLGYEADTTFGSDAIDGASQAVPSLFLSHRLKDSPLALGFGVYCPFALGANWGKDAAFTAAFPSPFAAVPYEAKLEYIKYHAVVAWQLTKTLSVAGGLSFDKSHTNLKANALDFEGDDQMVGYTVSLHWKPSAEHAFGLNYQARTEATYEGTSNVAVGLGPAGPITLPLDAKSDFIFPESITLGYSYRPNTRWNLEFNLDWTNWDRVNKWSLDGVPGAEFELNWKSALIWQLGATRYFDNGWHLSASYTFVEDAIPDADFLPIVPDSNRHFCSIGIGRHYDHISWQFTYQQAFADIRSISGNTTSPSIDGDYDLDSISMAFSLSYRF